jgi:hypothetical protein
LAYAEDEEQADRVPWKWLPSRAVRWRDGRRRSAWDFAGSGVTPFGGRRPVIIHRQHERLVIDGNDSHTNASALVLAGGRGRHDRESGRIVVLA